MKRGLTLYTERSIDVDGNTILKGTFSIKIYGVVIHSGGYLKKTITTEGKVTTTEIFQINDSTSVTIVTAHNRKLTITENVNGNIASYEEEGTPNYSMIGKVCAQAVEGYTTKVRETEQLAILDDIYPITIDGTKYNILDVRSQQNHIIFISELGFGIQLPPEFEELQIRNIDKYPKPILEAVILAINEIKATLQGTTTPIIINLKLANKLKFTSAEEVTKDDESSTLATAPSLAYETDGEELTWTMAAAAPPTNNPVPTAIEETPTAEPVAAPPTPLPAASISGAMPDTHHDTSNG